MFTSSVEWPPALSPWFWRPRRNRNVFRLCAFDRCKREGRCALFAPVVVSPELSSMGLSGDNGVVDVSPDEWRNSTEETKRSLGCWAFHDCCCNDIECARNEATCWWLADAELPVNVLAEPPTPPPLPPATMVEDPLCARLGDGVTHSALWLSALLLWTLPWWWCPAVSLWLVFVVVVVELLDWDSPRAAAWWTVEMVSLGVPMTVPERESIWTDDEVCEMGWTPTLVKSEISDGRCWCLGTSAAGSRAPDEVCEVSRLLLGSGTSFSGFGLTF